MTLKALIVEDDANMQLILKKVLDNLSGVKVIGEASDGNEAINKAIELEPDVIFMDIDIPEKNGLEVSNEILDINPNVFLIYATGHCEYMPEAFEMYAFDYLLKPYKVDRIAQTINKIQKLVETREKALNKEHHVISTTETISKKIALKLEQNIVFIESEKILFISREKRKTIVYLENDKIMLNNESLEVLEMRLAQNNFFRSHRSYLINLNKVTEIQPWSRGNYLIIFNNTKKAAYMTDNKYRAVKEKFKII